MYPVIIREAREIIPVILLFIIVAGFAYYSYIFEQSLEEDLVKQNSKGYISDEVWYVNSARNILHKVFGVDPWTPYGECYSVFFSKKPNLDTVRNVADELGVEIVDDSYDKANCVYVKVSSREQLNSFINELEARDQKVVDTIRGWRYGDAENINNYLNTEHPPLAKYLIALSMLVLGDYPLAWRIPSMVVGVAMLVLVYLVVYSILEEYWGREKALYIALAAPLGLALDPLHQAMSVLALLDIHVGFFTLLTLYILVSRKDLGTIVSGIISSLAKFSGLFSLIPHWLNNLFLKTRLNDRIMRMIFYLAVYFLLFLGIQIIASLPLIGYLGFNTWFDQAITGAVKWHTSLKCTSSGCPTASSPWDWLLGRNSFTLFYWSTGESIVARGIWPFYLASTVMAIIFTPLVFKLEKYRYAWLSLVGVYGGYIILWILGGRTQYSFYLAQLAPVFYLHLVVITALMFRNEIWNIYNDFIKQVREILIVPSEKAEALISPLEIVVYTLIFISIGLSFILHMPGGNPSIYSDVVSIYYRVYGGSAEGWYTHVMDYGLPYIHYKFEYPPLVGILWAISTLPRLFLSGDKAVYAHYVLQTLFTGSATILLANDMLWLSKRLKTRIPVYILFVFPSFIIYGIYNWDIIAIALGVRGLRYVLEDKKKLAGILLGLAAATKIYPGLFALAVLREKKREAIDVIYYAVVTGLILLIIMAINPSGFSDFLNHHLGWYIEGSWWLLIADNPWDKTVISIAKFLMPLSLILVLLPKLRGSTDEKIIVRSWLVLVAPLLFSYVYTPQMNLMIIPLAVLLATPVILPILAIQDLATATVILTWFIVDDPLGKYSMPSIASYIKCFLLAIVLAINLLRYIEFEKSKEVASLGESMG
ncbi:MAG: DUF2029 domain-containing protein [Desulfurococcales archaeon]|nr:DUF2029 domain-containing protein [Desulfurococcales archaeon]